MSISLIKSLKLHRDKVWSIDCSKGMLATGSTDRSVKIIDASQYKLLDELDNTVHKKAVRSVAWRPNSFVLAAGSFDSTISIWTKEGEEEMDNSWEMELLAIIEGHENEVKSVAWSHDGAYLASCSRDKSVWIWESDEMGEEYECISVLQEHSQDVKHVVWHPFLQLLASSSYDDTIRIWREYDDDWESAAVLNGHEGTVWSSDFEKSETRLRICSGSDDARVKIWRYLRDDEEEQQEWICEATMPSVHSRAIYSVSWNEDGSVASVGSDGKLVIYQEAQQGEWEIAAQQELCHGVHEVNVVKWVKINDKTMLATGGDDGYINLWNWDQSSNSNKNDQKQHD
ncbi:cytosolic iron-sulfur protein assembly protein [Zygosaccharomyces mellis]|uniref:Probable cytosolic iron-sulfur protein assembly protein 1 n=1 Tax=Zygosaccharomyces mellis TaxID=42258 RepID=A0A4C2E632_9SACH|nr:cytosolic iron-sulfur protein assembly protein [Zygosaccharomyces mellis]